MKIAIISDIHSNVKALRRVLKDAREQGCTEVVCLGDICGYGYDPQGCIDILLNKEKLEGMSCSTIVMGNHDAALGDKLSISWFSDTAAAGIRRQKNILSEKTCSWLGKLPYTASRGFDSKDLTVFYAHGSYVPEDVVPPFFNDGIREAGIKEMFPYMFGHIIVKQNVDVMRKIGSSKNILFVGHTHERRVCLVDGPFDLKNINKCFTEFEDVDAIDHIRLVDGRTVVMNAGSVGYPRLEPFTSYVVFDTDDLTVRYRKLRFFFREYVTCMNEKGIPIPGWMVQWRVKNGDDYIYIDEKEYKK